jgi:ABC-type transport system substrate-binding protein
VPARVEPLLAALVPTEVMAEGGENIAGVSKGGFVAVESNADRVVYRRAIPEPNGLTAYHVAEIVERRYPSYDKAVLGLRQGEVSMLVDLPDWIVRRVQVDPKLKEELFIQQYALPTTHVLQLNPQSPALRIREFRRALLHAIDRERILKQTVLRDPTAAHGRVVTSPFPSFSPANSFDAGQHSFDTSAALALVLAAAQQLNNELPTLKMLVPPTPVERAAAAELIKYWKRVRIDVEIVEPGTISDEDSGWDICYRTLQSAEPTVELWPFLANAPTAQIGDLAIFPDWLRQALVDVDRTSDWGRALETLRGLHPKLWSEVRYLPLWEVDQFLVVRKNVQGFAERPLHSYHGIERWTMQAWYPAE